MRLEQMLQRIQGEFAEMPGLRLTAPQARRLWGLDQEVCGGLLRALVEAGFLVQTQDGAFVRREGSPAEHAGSHRRRFAAAS